MARSPLDKQFADLVDAHHASLRGFVRALGVAPDYVDDVAQEAFLRAFADFDRFDEGRDFGRWLRGIARNIVRNELRARARHARILHERIADIMIAHADDLNDPLEDLDGGEPLLDALRVCTERLTERSRSMLEMRYAMGMLAHEIAAQTDSSASAVRQALVRIRETLRQCLIQELREGPR